MRGFLRKASITKKDICNGLGRANDWFELDRIFKNDILSGLQYINEKAAWLSEIVNKNYNGNCDADLKIRKSKICRRSLGCYYKAISHLINNEFIDSFHEIHDFMFGFGKELGNTVTDVEYLLLNQWTSAFDVVYKKYIGISNE